MGIFSRRSAADEPATISTVENQIKRLKARRTELQRRIAAVDRTVADRAAARRAQLLEHDDVADPDPAAGAAAVALEGERAALVAGLAEIDELIATAEAQLSGLRTAAAREAERTLCEPAHREIEEAAAAAAKAAERLVAALRAITHRCSLTASQHADAIAGHAAGIAFCATTVLADHRAYIDQMSAGYIPVAPRPQPRPVAPARPAQPAPELQRIFLLDHARWSEDAGARVAGRHTTVAVAPEIAAAAIKFGHALPVGDPQIEKLLSAAGPTWVAPPASECTDITASAPTTPKVITWRPAAPMHSMADLAAEGRRLGGRA